MRNDLCKKIVNTVQDTICKNTTPDFNKDGKPINVWEVLPGYDEIKSVIEAQFTDVGEVSDGYHTFNELYHHRAVLFSVLCNVYSDRAWKSKKHSDGTMYDGMFIVGINTPEGQATYHYDIDPYWDMFDVPELEFSPEWDGHTSDDAIERIMSLKMRSEVTSSNDVMTDKDIIKALRCCNDIRWCNHCPLYKVDFCKDKLSDVAIDLFDRLKAKNKELAEENVLYKGLVDCQKAKIERLQKEDKILSVNADTAFQDGLNEVQDLYAEHIKSKIKSEAIKENIQKVKDIINSNYNKHIFGSNDLEAEEKDAIINFSDDVSYDIDNLVKETEADNNE